MADMGSFGSLYSAPYYILYYENWLRFCPLFMQAVNRRLMFDFISNKSTALFTSCHEVVAPNFIQARLHKRYSTPLSEYRQNVYVIDAREVLGNSSA